MKPKKVQRAMHKESEMFPLSDTDKILFPKMLSRRSPDATYENVHV